MIQTKPTNGLSESSDFMSHISVKTMRKREITQYNITKRTQARPKMAEPLHIHTAHEKSGEYNVSIYWRAQEARCHFSLLLAWTWTLIRKRYFTRTVV